MSTIAATWTLNVAGLPQIKAESKTETSSAHDSPQEVIYGVDTRERTNALDYGDGGKYRSIVKLQSRFEGLNGDVWIMGTGWLVSHDTLVTAGHLVFDHTHSYGGCTQIKCFIGYDGAESVTKPGSGVQFRYGRYIATPQKWTQQVGGHLHDVAFVRVHKPFTGNLNVFSFIDTQPSARVVLGVVGYPGDKLVRGERGAQMYSEFMRITYGLAENPSHMISYDLFGGQSGSPIIAKTKDGSLVIGTHCCQDGGSGRSLGSSIGGKWGNPYTKYLDLFKRQANFVPQINTIQYISLDSASTLRRTLSSTSISLSSPRLSPPIGENYIVEGFLDVLKAIARVGSTTVTPGAPFLGPIGSSVAPVAGALLGAIVEKTSSISNSPNCPATPGAAERAILAESSLQAVLNLYERSPDHPIVQTILSSMSKEYMYHAPEVGPIAIKLATHLTECAFDIVAFKFAMALGVSGSGEPMPELVRQPLTGMASPEGTVTEDAFFQGLRSAIVPVSGVEDGAFNFVGHLITMAAKTTIPLVSHDAKSAIVDISPHLLCAPNVELASPPATNMSAATQSTSKLVFQRALMADVALSALRKLPRYQLDHLAFKESGRSHTEGIFVSIKHAAQEIGPYVLVVAQTAIQRFAPTLVDAAASMLKERLSDSTGSTTTSPLVLPQSVRALERKPAPTSITSPPLTPRREYWLPSTPPSKLSSPRRILKRPPSLAYLRDDSSHTSDGLFSLSE
ncbi:hypothetical protein ONZ45_g8298 [Pleurotus djamor]|nr:hypothetical protein ONZ45_g8298 [Pleurotus djamor]